MIEHTKLFLDIITVTKDDFDGVANTIKSTRALRAGNGIRQIIVDSSIEGTREKVKELLNGEEHIEYVWQAPIGITPAFNLGLSMAKAEWVWFLNGRDEIHPDLDTEKFLYLFNASSADAIIFELEFMQSRTRYKHYPMCHQWPPVFNWIPHPATIVRKQMFEEYGVFDDTYKIAMDYDLWLRFFSQDVIVDTLSIPIVLYDEGGFSSVNMKCLGEEGGKIIRSNMWMLIKMWLQNGINIYSALRHLHKLTKSGRSK